MNAYEVSFTYEKETTVRDTSRGFAEYDSEYSEHEATETVHAKSLRDALETLAAESPKGTRFLYATSASRNGGKVHRV